MRSRPWPPHTSRHTRWLHRARRRLGRVAADGECSGDSFGRASPDPLCLWRRASGSRSPVLGATRPDPDDRAAAVSPGVERRALPVRRDRSAPCGGAWRDSAARWAVQRRSPVTPSCRHCPATFVSTSTSWAPAGRPRSRGRVTGWRRSSMCHGDRHLAMVQCHRDAGQIDAALRVEVRRNCRRVGLASDGLGNRRCATRCLPRGGARVARQGLVGSGARCRRGVVATTDLISREPGHDPHSGAARHRQAAAGRPTARSLSACGGRVAARVRARRLGRRRSEAGVVRYVGRPRTVSSPATSTSPPPVCSSSARCSSTRSAVLTTRGPRCCSRAPPGRHRGRPSGGRSGVSRGGVRRCSRRSATLPAEHLQHALTFAGDDLHQQAGVHSVSAFNLGDWRRYKVASGEYSLAGSGQEVAALDRAAWTMRLGASSHLDAEDLHDARPDRAVLVLEDLLAWLPSACRQPVPVAANSPTRSHHRHVRAHEAFALSGKQADFCFEGATARPSPCHAADTELAGAALDRSCSVRSPRSRAPTPRVQAPSLPPRPSSAQRPATASHRALRSLAGCPRRPHPIRPLTPLDGSR